MNNTTILYFSTNGIIKHGIILQYFISLQMVLPFVKKWSIVVLYMFYYTICKEMKYCSIIPCFIIPFVEKWSIVVLYNVLLYHL
jgi:hypothetical protein